MARSRDLFHTEYLQSVALLPSRRYRVAAGLLVLFLLYLPFNMSGSNTIIATSMLLAVVGAVALNLLTGNVGIVSLGQAAFLGIGAFVSTYLARDLDLPFPVVVLGAGLASGLIGAMIGIPSLRWRGLYVILGTFALHFIVRFVLNEYEIKKVGPGGFTMPKANLFGWTARSHRDFYFIALVAAALTVLAAVNLQRSAIGRAWIAIRDRDIAAAITGINVARQKVIAFVLTSFIVGVAGSLNAYFVGHVTSENYTLNLAIQYVAMIIIGGMGSVLGSVLGAAFVVMLPKAIEAFVDYLPESYPLGDWIEKNIFDLQIGLYGLLIIVFLMVEPGGLAALWRRVKLYFDLWPFKQRRLTS
jgi:branched-chain amino acid transport system permease protein